MDKELEKIPLGSSIIALADIHDRLEKGGPPLQEPEGYRTIEGIEKLGGRAFPHVAIYALHEATSSPENKK